MRHGAVRRGEARQETRGSQGSRASSQRLFTGGQPGALEGGLWNQTGTRALSAGNLHRRFRLVRLLARAALVWIGARLPGRDGGADDALHACPGHGTAARARPAQPYLRARGRRVKRAGRRWSVARASRLFVPFVPGRPRTSSASERQTRHVGVGCVPSCSAAASSSDSERTSPSPPSASNVSPLAAFTSSFSASVSRAAASSALGFGGRRRLAIRRDRVRPVGVRICSRPAVAAPTTMPCVPLSSGWLTMPCTTTGHEPSSIACWAVTSARLGRRALKTGEADKAWILSLSTSSR